MIRFPWQTNNNVTTLSLTIIYYFPPDEVPVCKEIIAGSPLRVIVCSLNHVLIYCWTYSLFLPLHWSISHTLERLCGGSWRFTALWNLTPLYVVWQIYLEAAGVGGSLQQGLKKGVVSVCECASESTNSNIYIKCMCWSCNFFFFCI